MAYVLTGTGVFALAAGPSLPAGLLEWLLAPGLDCNWEEAPVLAPRLDASLGFLLVFMHTFSVL
ncbi:hypothetical protein D3C74_494320 [compost metagenome]